MSDINDQMSERAIVLCIKAIRLDAKLLAKAFKAILDQGNKIIKGMSTPESMSGQGKQTVKELTRQGQGVSNIEITSKNIKSFESIARKYGVDFALMKDNAESPPKWLVFFKARDADVLTAAFKEFSAREAKRSKGKPSLLASLEQFAKLVKDQVVDKVKNKSHGEPEL